MITELGVGKALVSLLDENGVPGIVQHTAIVCPQSLMAPCAEAAEQSRLDAEREAFEKEKAAWEAQKQKEAEAAEKQRQKEIEAEEKRRQREIEKQQAAYDRAVERRRAKIESQVISAGGQILKRGLMNTLFGGKKR